MWLLLSKKPVCVCEIDIATIERDLWYTVCDRFGYILNILLSIILHSVYMIKTHDVKDCYLMYLDIHVDKSALLKSNQVTVT